uniref:Uncharacterized protein n=1 Tax=Arundo donax TaxID=35708 RepID=A0A0A9EGG2_ARUDO
MYAACHEEHTEPARTRSGISNRVKMSIRISSGSSICLSFTIAFSIRGGRTNSSILWIVFSKPGAKAKTLGKARKSMPHRQCRLIILARLYISIGANQNRISLALSQSLGR